MKDGIKVTTVCPGLMRTGSPRNADFKGKHEFEYAWFSVSDALPLLTVSAEHAARQVVRACKRGDAELVISVPAMVAVLFESLFPEAMSQMLALANRMLPEAGGVGTERRKGRESTSAWSPSWISVFNEEAAERKNEEAHRKKQQTKQDLAVGILSLWKISHENINDLTPREEASNIPSH